MKQIRTPATPSGVQRGPAGMARTAAAAGNEAIEREAELAAARVLAAGGSPYARFDWSAANGSPDAQERTINIAQREGATLRRAEKNAPAARASKAHPLLADDDAMPAAGQMSKTAFLDALRGELCATVDAALAGTGRDSQGCPWIAHWLGFYATRSAAQVEASLHRYAPETTGAATPQHYIAAVTRRVRVSAEAFARTGKVSGVPDEAGPASKAGGVLFKAKAGGGRDADGAAVQAQLGKGQSLPGTVRARMQSAFGAGFGGVRLHVDANAARLSEQLNARAFTVGRDVAFASGEYRPGTPMGDALIAHELAHVLQQGDAGEPGARQVGAETAELEKEADGSAFSAVASFFGAALGGLAGARRGARPAGGAGLRLQRCKSDKEKAREADIARLGGLQYEFLEQERLAEQQKQRKAAEEAAKKAGLPPPVKAPDMTVDELIMKKTKAADPPGPADAWTSLKPEEQRKWEQDAKKAWAKVVASVAGTELEKVVKGKTMEFTPKRALEENFFGAQWRNKLLVGMQWVELANADPKNVWPNVAHELGGHFEYGTTHASEIMRKALEKLPEAERKKWTTDPVYQQKFFMEYEYAETEIFAELRERRYSKPEVGTAPPNPSDSPDLDVPHQLRELKKNMHPEVAKAVVADLKRRVDASPNILARDKTFFAEQVKLVYGDLP